MKNKKMITILLLIVLIILDLSINIYGLKKSYLYNSGEQSISVMVFNTTTNTFVYQNTVPTGNYTINTNLSYCEGNGNIQSYNNTTGIVSTLIDGQDKCYYYFDKIVNTPVILNVTPNSYYPAKYAITIYKYDITLSFGSISKFYVSSDNQASYKTIESNNSYVECFDDDLEKTLYIYAETTDGDITPVYSVASYRYTCFTGDTKIKSENGYTNIENIKVGDKVYSYNEQTQKLELKEVTKTLIHDDNRIYEIRVGNKIIKVTPDHRIYVKAKYGNKYNWTKVYNIHEGDYLLDSNNNGVRIDSIKYYESKDTLKVYNIEVQDNHTYYVTAGDYLVHNAKEPSVCESGPIIVPPVVVE